MGCFKICFASCNNQKVPTKQILPSIHKHKRLVRFEPLQPTKPVVKVSKSVIFDFGCRGNNNILVDHDNKEKESKVYNNGNRKCTILGNEKEEKIVGSHKFLDFSLSKLEGTAELEGQKESSKSLNIAGNCNLGEESSDKQLNGLYNVGQLLQEESSDSLYSASVGLIKQDDGLDDVDQLVQEESSDSLFSVSVGSKKKVKVAENGDVLAQEESSDSLFSVSVGSRNRLNVLDSVDQLVQEESSDSLFSVSVGSRKKVNAVDNSDLLVPEESSDSLFSVSFESRKQVNAVKADENEVNSPVTFGLKHKSKHCNPSPTLASSVLGPIENLTNWKKGIKVTTDNTYIELKDHEKENMSSVQELNLLPFSVEEPSLKSSNNTISKQQKGSLSKVEGSPLAVDTSLSSWLVKSDGESSENTTILAASPCEELKQHTFTASPRRSPSRDSSDELLIIGTSGSYWSHTRKPKNSSGSNSSRGRVPT